LCRRLADVQQRTVLYTFPTDEELRDFSRHRIRPVLRASEHLRGRMSADGVNNVGQKQIGFDGWLYFRGVNGGPVDSVPADIAVFDEYDTSDQANIEGSERRVTGPMSAG
jgi:phage terminase large subunit GpA-like protein